MKNKIISIIAALIITLPLAAQVKKGKTTKSVEQPVAKEIIDRSIRPVAGPAPVIKIGDYQSFELPNGLKVFVVENHKIPRLSYSLVLDNDPVFEGEMAGYTGFAGELLRKGTTTRTKDQIDEQVDMLGASLNTSASGISANCLTRHNEALLTIMSDVLLNSNFKAEELEKIRTQSLSALEASKTEPKAISQRVNSILVYGDNHPYGENESEESVKKITLDKCTEYYKTYFKPNVAYLAIVGDITLEQAKPLVEKYFGSWQRGDVPKANYPTPKAPAKATVVIVDRPTAVQSTISVSYPVDLKPGSPDDIKVKLTNSILGGGTFRLFNNLREKHGWTYGAYSSLQADKLIGQFNASAEVRNPVTDSSFTEILAEMSRIRTEPVPDDELNMVRNYMMGNFGRSLENPATVANFAISTARYNLPKDYYATYLTRLGALTSSDVQLIAQKYIRPDNSYLLVVGKAEEIAPKLKKFAKSGEVLYYDIDGKQYDPTKKLKPAPAGVTAEVVINNYITAIGGVKKLKKIKDATINAGATMQGMPISLDIYYKAPDKMFMQVGSGAMVFAKQVYNAGKGISSSPMSGESKPIEGEELAGMKEASLIFPEMYYTSLGYTFELLGIEEQKDQKQYYKIVVNKGTDRKDTEYYDVQSGLKIRNEGKQGTTEYSDYKPVDGILFPHGMTQNMGPQTISFTVSGIKLNSKLKDEFFEVK
ncbi:MAG: insulinase family protein [Bacteroidales bacterium]|nr:insulinase family protein [Bacteroidales bacterium]